jgi:hypothetical protein
MRRLCAAKETQYSRTLESRRRGLCVPSLRLCAARETLLAERLRAAKLRVDLRVVEYTQKQKQTANRRGRRPEREATAARRRHESTKSTLKTTKQAQKRHESAEKHENKTQEARKQAREKHENETQEARKQAERRGTDRQKHKHRRVGAVGEVTCGARFCPLGGFPSSFTRIGIQAYRHTSILWHEGNTKA